MLRIKGKVAVKLLALWLALVALVVLPIGQTVQATPCNFNVIATINVDIQPFGVTTSPDGNTVWVANSGSVFANSNKVTIINVNTLTEDPNKITVGNFPEDIAFTDDGAQAFVTNSSDATVSVINTATRTVTQTVSLAPAGLSFPFGIVTNKNDKKVFVTSQGGSPNSIAVLDNRNRNNVTLSGTIPASGFTARPALRPIGNELLVPISGFETGPPRILIINPSSEHITHEVTLEGNTTSFPNDVAVTPDGRFAYVALLDFSGGPGGVWVIDLKRLRTVTVINTGDPHVHGVGITPDGRFVFATNFIQNTVAVINTATNTVVATVPVGHQPNEVAVSLDGTKAFVTNQNDTTVSVICIPQP
jgi:YVTN family beta-propeller protein